ncbi:MULTISPECIES: M20/M25/M40 family metallo-hydrolase [unclassified Kaistella]|uniref:M20/M25/M40 family metallo-hydrolase n=1 Tax=unclassified Kaistella TaxID=2762626 RepID=UPI002736A564|nr:MULTISPECIES: M20/M25/M40 family metallo-hydrolase [unclassified Kaistella]MDP2455008.1 M20/M25/M40 family metallo-hydrolase [Kaistella sp. SH11-4b]MDP2456009.1 M20/M25/M40 family metallo-hydrolase [Kaistella sp. SH40-3]MDP2460678.1 M20/M25/M40 family metallo-hydrolase [Kaistella sp. SH19-2b]
MKKSVFFLSVLLSVAINAQKQEKDPEISEYVKLVSKDSLKANIEKFVSFGTRHTMSSTTDQEKGIGAARSWVLSKFRNYSKNSGGRMEFYLQNEDLQPDGKRINKVTNLGNAIALLKGTDPSDKRIVIISGHLDSRVSEVMNSTDYAPGANDDGSGVAAVIESARVLSKSKFPMSILFVAVSGEEQGLLGAKMLADKAKKENWEIEAVLNNDMIGNNSFDAPKNDGVPKLRVFSEGLSAFETEKSAAKIRNFGLENDGNARQLARYVKEIGEKYVKNIDIKLIYRNDRFLRGGDHTPFVNHGFTAVRLTDYYENYDHQHQDIRTENNKKYGDLIEFMDFDYLKTNTAVNVAVLANLAKSTPQPLNVLMDVKELSNSTKLSWEKPNSGKVKGYQVLIRETSSPVWTERIFTTEASITIPLSKDNYLFAVESISTSGNQSLPVIPKVSR